MGNDKDTIHHRTLPVFLRGARQDGITCRGNGTCSQINIAHISKLPSAKRNDVLDTHVSCPSAISRDNTLSKLHHRPHGCHRLSGVWWSIKFVANREFGSTWRWDMSRTHGCLTGGHPSDTGRPSCRPRAAPISSSTLSPWPNPVALFHRCFSCHMSL